MNWHFLIQNKKRKDLFFSISQVLKICTSHIHVTLNAECIHIQGMDKSHVCLFDLYLKSTWFDEYNVPNETQLCLDANILYSILNTRSDDQNISVQMTSTDVLHIALLDGGYNKFFDMPLMDYDYEEMAIPPVDYDAEFSLSAKNISNLLSQLSTFGTDLQITCTDNDVDFETQGTSGVMRVRVHIDDMTSYSVIEGQRLQVSYSLSYVSKMCVSSKLSTDIEFSLSEDSPMRVKYDLGEDSSLLFYIAPKASFD